MYLLIDGDYFLSGFKPDSEAAVKAAVDRLHAAIDEQLLPRRGTEDGQPTSPSATGPHIDLRVVLFSTALLNSLPETQRTAVVSVLRRMRFQCTILESVRGRLGSPVDAALCTRAITYAMMPYLGHDRAVPETATRAVFCFVTPNAYIASALELLTTRGCDVVFAVYDGDEVAEELLGYISPAYGRAAANALGGIAHLPKSDGVVFIPNTEAASAALAALQQDGKDLPLSLLQELTRLRDSLTHPNKPDAVAAGARGSGDGEAAVLPTPQSTISAPNTDEKKEEATASSIVAARRRQQVEADLVIPPPSPAAQPAAAVATTTKPTMPLTDLLTTNHDTTAAPGTVNVTKTVFIPTTTAPTPVPMLPEDWEERIDPRTGRKFYVNHRTRQTSWTPPPPQQPAHPAQQHPGQPPLAAQQQAPHVPPRTLPQPTAIPWPWEARVDPQTRRTYYINHQTRKTSWTLPV